MILGWQDLDGQELVAAWGEVETWVWWLRSTYPAAREAVVDCWPRHPDLINELTALLVWWEEIHEPDAAAVPAAGKPAAGSDDHPGRSAVSWHEALNHAVQRFRVSTRCSRSECELDKQIGDLAGDWRSRHARTLGAIDDVRGHRAPLLGAGGQPTVSEAPVS